MIIHNVEQNSQEWLDARRGIVTASAISDVLSKGRGSAPSKTRYAYMMKLLAERVAIDQINEFQGNRYTERGHILEPEARALYAFINDCEPQEVGFITNDEKTAGASPDSLINDDGCMEIKSKMPAIHLPVLFSQEVPKEHEPQIQTQLWIAEREWCDFVSYCPNLPLVQVRVYRDEARIKEIAKAVDDFNNELNDLEQKIRSM
ncbi:MULTISPECIES: lambda exonuclease family protein [unclassified Methylophaga]|jgi:putative phage-type endonuclease|uniref:lambda exonuclease family protein n=1 Tax=unclassified Methylophaga TaxID=2629249 RepID=UPI00259C8D9C|nr:MULTISPECIES: lambda exonuclease family protein [unclassified Methylophaga]|tara:strand:+ start:37697 stop:38308 length:612 start_codon:yes stop_codon:yes gene_type:complete